MVGDGRQCDGEHSYLPSPPISNFQFRYVLVMFYSLALDYCKAGLHRCHSNADCTPTFGGYQCKCREGYTGDGFTCAGKDLAKLGAIVYGSEVCMDFGAIFYFFVFACGDV